MPERAAIPGQIAPLRQRLKRLHRIRKETPRMLSLLRTELQLEYEVKHPIKQQQKQRSRNLDMER